MDIKNNKESPSFLNYGYDDKQGRYIVYPNELINSKYRLKKILGQGVFGECYKAHDTKELHIVAIKIIKNKPLYHKQGEKEIAILKILQSDEETKNSSIVNMIESFIFNNHIMIIFEPLGINLYNALKLGVKDYFDKTGHKLAIVGISGGIDSALTATIAADALGNKNVIGISMPSQFSTQHSIEDAQILAENLDIK